MANFMKNAMSYLGMADVVDEDADVAAAQSDNPATDFDSDRSVTPMSQESSNSVPLRSHGDFSTKISRITTILPKSYEDAQLVGRALRDGVPVVLNLSNVTEAVAYRIVDFSAGVVFGVRGSIERVTPRVFLLSPAQVNIKVEDPKPTSSSHDLFSD
ncbi:cell division protein SepF [Bifidobacterium aquikefiricola]|uniref:Cell division protein SepF n=1 Tax=Bifidobacterium aquikefiricola TaxID=3059038 RepID=A0AB39U4M5_9BIFI